MVQKAFLVGKPKIPASLSEERFKGLLHFGIFLRSTVEQRMFCSLRFPGEKRFPIGQYSVGSYCFMAEVRYTFGRASFVHVFGRLVVFSPPSVAIAAIARCADFEFHLVVFGPLPLV